MDFVILFFDPSICDFPLILCLIRFYIVYLNYGMHAKCLKCIVVKLGGKMRNYETITIPIWIKIYYCFVVVRGVVSGNDIRLWYSSMTVH